jgi:hypothetical protein
MYRNTQDSYFSDLKPLPLLARNQLGKCYNTVTTDSSGKARIVLNDYENNGFSKISYHPSVVMNTTCKGVTEFCIREPSVVKSVRLYVENDTIDVNYSCSYLEEKYPFSLLSNGNSIPLFANKQIRIELETFSPNESITFSYKVGTYNIDSLRNLEWKFYTEQFTIDTFSEKDTQRITLPFNHPITHMSVFLPEETTDARIILDGHDHGLLLSRDTGSLYSYKKGEQSYVRYTIYFGEPTSINFTAIDSASLHVVLSKPCPGAEAVVVSFAKQALVATYKSATDTSDIALRFTG